ncbi:MAG: hypothetical protein FNP40_05905 [Dehalobacter sp. 4CP]|uniref:hypothetical protein n=1 Tax=Dehalobacter sp. CP TaxID=2594474 RepID=UPI0013C85BF3|nr:hypothetical protein [Dehalobacter sp.]NBJ15095.1 hypothetical protein [Dehalobacter sp. 4CP]
MNEIFSWAAIVFIGGLFVQAIILFKIEPLERKLIDDKKKVLLDFVLGTFIGFPISLVIYNFYLQQDLQNATAFVTVSILCFFLALEVLYFLFIPIAERLGYGKNFYIEDKEHDRLYIIKNSTNKFILLADKPMLKEATYTIFIDEESIKNQKIFTENKKLNNDQKQISNEKKEATK